MGDGVSVVIPTGGRARLHLLDAMLARLRRCDGIDQIILSELGEEACALDVAQRWDAEHLFTAMPAPYDRAAARNAGIALVRCDLMMWCDGDLVFRPDFVRRAQGELCDRGLDFLAPFATVNYLDEGQTDAVIAGHCEPWDCQPIRVLGSMWNGASGGIWLIRRDFLRRHGGIPSGFQGWGYEDCAWLRKADLLGRSAPTAHDDQRAWHLFHPDSGSHSDAAALGAERANPHYARNRALLDRMMTIADGAAWEHAFPPPTHAALPWPATARPVFVTTDRVADTGIAARWAARLHANYAADVPVLRVTRAALPATLAACDADAVVAFAGDAADHVALASAGARPDMLVVDHDVSPAAWGEGAPPLVLARDAATIAPWRAAGYPVWHGAWDEAADESAAPVLVQPLSHLLAGRAHQPAALAAPVAAAGDWRIRIVIDRAALTPSALDRPRFWYVGVHDADDVELARDDLTGSELRHAVAGDEGAIVIDRVLRSIRRPARWTVWPVDRGGFWLDPLSGEVAGDDMIQEGRV